MSKSVDFTRLETSRVIDDYKEVRVTKMNHILEVLALEKEPKALLDYKKLDKHRYVDLKSGEILDYQLNENRGQNIASLKRTFKRLRNLINNNFVGAKNELFVTLTYAECMTDVKQLMIDFDVFMKRFRRKYPNIDYLSVVEPQGRGAWHCHVLIRFNDLDDIFIKNNEVLAPMWGHGFTSISRLDNIDNIGAYLNAYLTDLEICDDNIDLCYRAIERSKPDFIDIGKTKVNINKDGHVNLKVVEKDFVDKYGNKVKKRFLKGARLYMYPSGMNLYRCSRGIVKPETEKMQYSEVKKIVGSRKANYSRTIDLSKKEDGQHINSITYEQYNLNRNKSKYGK